MKRGLLWLACGFTANGLAQFLQKYLHGAGLGSYQASALIAMYAAASLLGLAMVLGFKGRLGAAEILGGLGVGVCSYTGNLAVLRALGYLPAYTVFPIVVGGPIMVVALYSRLFAGERLGGRARAGIVCGLAAVLLLTLG